LRRILHRAPIVYNGLGMPRKDGGVLVQEALGKRTVVAVDDGTLLADSYPDAERCDEPFALSPAPVNAHTHLDLSGMPYTECAYQAFIPAVMEHGRSGCRSLASAKAGVAELLAAGTRVVGDIVTREDVMRFLLGHQELSGVAYWEVIGPDPADAERIVDETEKRLDEFALLVRPGGMRLGLAPHTPHTVSGPLLKALTVMARRRRLPMQIHVAESAGEIGLHRDGSGPLATLVRDWIPDWRPSGLSPVAYLESLGVLEANPALVHMIHVSDDDIATVERNGCVIIHCPRSNVALGCGRFPWERYARKGATVAIGTDSRGSSPSLRVEDEVAAATVLHGSRAGAQPLVWAAVKGGYRALGMTPPRFVRGDDAAILHAWHPAAHLE
jgi:cytosine/adenosine deaminase-related metal-dependent hydrolase